ncbi:MAG TPA: ribonuclease J [Acidobacteriota bacterium]|nr:ribonuclease J [Acidobacteriota bacterium]HNJ40210.1 ribonuclease J [Acidobacteriota bacterium]
MINTPVEIIPLGGLGEFGMNCLALRYDGSMIIIDVGLMFSEVGHYGVDIMIPDFSYVEEHRDELLAIVLTHSHEDHIGALPFLLQAVNVPVYGTPYTLSVADRKLDEHKLTDCTQTHTIHAGESFTVGPFTVEFIRVSHSTVDCVALAVTTPVGVVIHTGDYKFDETPVCGDAIDIERLKEYGRRGVLALLSDSTNVERPGRMPSERAVIPALEDIFDQTDGRIFVSCFASSIHRIQIILDLADDFGRSVFPVGRGMLRSLETADQNGFLRIPDGLLLTASEYKQTNSEDVVVLATGCQGEPMAAMSRMANQNHKQAIIEAGDTVILSARQIPGNEKSISRLINECYKRNAFVYDSSSARIHVSGHGAQEDLRLMIESTRPRYFIPIHGEYRQLYRHKLYACQELDYEPENVILMQSGEVLALDGERALISDKIQVGKIYMDDSRSVIVDEAVMRDRKHLAYDGIIIPVLVVNKETGEMKTEPEIATCGYMLLDGNEEWMDELKDVINQTLTTVPYDERSDMSAFKEKIRLGLKRYIQKLTKQRPTILPVIMQV